MPEENQAVHPEPEAPNAGTPAGVPSLAAKLAAQPLLVMALLTIVVLAGLLLLMPRRAPTKEPASESYLTQLQAELNAVHAELNRERMSMGLRPLESTGEPLDEVAKRVKKDADTLVAAVNTYQSLLAEKETEYSESMKKLLQSEQTRQSLSLEIKRLEGDLRQALVNGSEAELLRKDLATMKAQRDALTGELAAVREQVQAQGGSASQREYDELKRRFDETLKAKEFFESKVRELTGDLAKAKLFATSEGELLPAAVELFRSLRRLENKPQAEIKAAYEQLSGSLGAEVLGTVFFATGSSQMAAADQQKVQAMVDAVDDGDLLLAVGYASETGNVDGNRILSSERATTVAKCYESNKRPAQLVQGVYLGQTDRFSNSKHEDNQRVEIWRVRKR